MAMEIVMQQLQEDLEIEYIAANWSNYDSIIKRVSNGEFDAFVGDITISAYRAPYVDFTQPFTDPGVAMLVSSNNYIKVNKIWSFLEPLHTDLWFASLGFFFFTGFVVWSIEHRINPNFRGTPDQQVGNTFYFIFSTLVFSHNGHLQSNLSRFAIIIWLFVVLILTQNYTASFSSMLTAERLKVSTDVHDLIIRGDKVGYSGDRNAAERLHSLGFKYAKLIPLPHEKYAAALVQGSANGGVSAVIDEIPYHKIFISTHCENVYTMHAIKPSLLHTTGTGGFGFAFPKNSPFTRYVSAAILGLKETDQIERIEMEWFKNSTICQDQGQEDSQEFKLSFRNFAGLFIITGVTSGLMLVTHLVIFIFEEWDIWKLDGSTANLPWRRVWAWIKHSDKIDLNSSVPAFRSSNGSGQSDVQHLEAQPNGMDSNIAVSTEMVIIADIMPISPSSEQLTVMPTDSDTEN